MPTLIEELKTLPPPDQGRLIERIEALPDAEARTLVRGLSGDAVARCQQDGLFFLKFVWTRDESDPLQSVKPFPVHKPYVRELWKILHQNPLVAIAKSRQMLVSWTVCAFCVWWARFHPHAAIYWQTQRQEDADEMVCTAGGGHAGRMQFIERHLPSWLQVKRHETHGNIQYEPNGSMIQALAGGANQIRGKVASIIVEDEFAHQEEARGVYTSVAPIIQRGTRFIAISTPNGRGNVFSDIYHGVPQQQAV